MKSNPTQWFSILDEAEEYAIRHSRGRTKKTIVIRSAVAKGEMFCVETEGVSSLGSGDKVIAKFDNGLKVGGEIRP